jgi:AcrR family transcriptional regulator
MATKRNLKAKSPDKMAARIQRECLFDKIKRRASSPKSAPSTSRAPLQSRAKATIDEILLAAVRILVRDGYDELNTNHIAEEAGISVSTLYQYFADKNAVLQTLVEMQCEKLVSDFEKNVADYAILPLAELVHKLIALMFESYLSNTRLFGLLRSQLPDSNLSQPLDRAVSQIAQLWAFALKVRRLELGLVDYQQTGFLITNATYGILDTLLKQRLSEAEVQDLTRATAEMILAFLNQQPQRSAS